MEFPDTLTEIDPSLPLDYFADGPISPATRDADVWEDEAKQEQRARTQRSRMGDEATGRRIQSASSSRNWKWREDADGNGFLIPTLEKRPKPSGPAPVTKPKPFHLSSTSATYKLKMDLEKQQREKEQREKRECSFRPKINKNLPTYLRKRKEDGTKQSQPKTNNEEEEKEDEEVAKSDRKDGKEGESLDKNRRSATDDVPSFFSVTTSNSTLDAERPRKASPRQRRTLPVRVEVKRPGGRTKMEKLYERDKYSLSKRKPVLETDEIVSQRDETVKGRTTKLPTRSRKIDKAEKPTEGTAEDSGARRRAPAPSSARSSSAQPNTGKDNKASRSSQRPGPSRAAKAKVKTAEEIVASVKPLLSLFEEQLLEGSPLDTGSTELDVEVLTRYERLAESHVWGLYFLPREDVNDNFTDLISYVFHTVRRAQKKKDAPLFEIVAVPPHPFTRLHLVKLLRKLPKEWTWTKVGEATVDLRKRFRAIKNPKLVMFSPSGELLNEHARESVWVQRLDGYPFSSRPRSELSPTKNDRSSPERRGRRETAVTVEVVNEPPPSARLVWNDSVATRRDKTEEKVETIERGEEDSEKEDEECYSQVSDSTETTATAPTEEGGEADEKPVKGSKGGARPSQKRSSSPSPPVRRRIQQSSVIIESTEDGWLGSRFSAAAPPFVPAMERESSDDISSFAKGGGYTLPSPEKRRTERERKQEEDEEARAETEQEETQRKDYTLKEEEGEETTEVGKERKKEGTLPSKVEHELRNREPLMKRSAKPATSALEKGIEAMRRRLQRMGVDADAIEKRVRTKERQKKREKEREERAIEEERQERNERARQWAYREQQRIAEQRDELMSKAVSRSDKRRRSSLGQKSEESLEVPEPEKVHDSAFLSLLANIEAEVDQGIRQAEERQHRSSQREESSDSS